jgi:uncharacterized protein YbjT (DUF2867 family)
VLARLSAGAAGSDCDRRHHHGVNIAVAGATGFVGRRLCPALVEAGHTVVGLSRSEHTASEYGITYAAVDVADEDEVAEALTSRSIDAAYYLVHSLGQGDFRDRDLALARAFARAARRAGVSRVVYLGGLGADPTSEHLMSRQEVGDALKADGPPLVELRAAVVLGSGSTSFEILRYLTERLPVMICPRWVATRIEPVAASDLVEYLAGSLDVAPGIYEIGCGEVTSYRDMIQAFARARGLSRRYILDVPYLTPRLSSYWVFIVTPVDRQVTASLIESLTTEVVATGREATRAQFGLEPMGIDEALRTALAEQATAVEVDVLSRQTGLSDGVYTARVTVPVPSGREEEIDADLSRIGGTYDWYGMAWAWRARQLAGRIFGERLRLGAAPAIEAGAVVDFWTVVERRSRRLVLRGRDWFPGDAWLGLEVGEGELVEVGAFRPRGAIGLLYWKLLIPIHHSVFRRMAEHRVTRIGAPVASGDIEGARLE